jgi:ferredoxin
MSDFLLSVDQLKCLRNDYAHNNCSICVDLCPERAINTDRRKLKIDESACTLCHGCIGVCPTEAIESQKFEPNFYIAKEIAFENNEIKQKLIGESLKMSCKDLGACLAVFDGLCIMVRGSLVKQLRFDEDTYQNTYNFYDYDYCLEARQLGYTVGVFDILLEHRSAGEGIHKPDWNETRIKFINKWINKGYSFPIR